MQKQVWRTCEQNENKTKRAQKKERKRISARNRKRNFKDSLSQCVHNFHFTFDGWWESRKKGAAAAEDELEADKTRIKCSLIDSSPSRYNYDDILCCNLLPQFYWDQAFHLQCRRCIECCINRKRMQIDCDIDDECKLIFGKVQVSAHHHHHQVYVFW